MSRRSECNRVAEDRWVPFVTTDAFVVIDGATPGLSANRKCVLSSALFWRVRVPLALK